MEYSAHTADMLILCTLTHLPLDKMAVIAADDIFKRIFLNESLFLRVQLIINQRWFRKRPGDKPLSKTMPTRFTDAYMQYQGGWVNCSGELPIISVFPIIADDGIDLESC